MSQKKSENKEVLYVIGNGFDLNLGLKTGYYNFFDERNINQVKDIVNFVRKDEKNIKEYNYERFETLFNILEKYDSNLKNIKDSFESKIHNKNLFEILKKKIKKRNEEEEEFLKERILEILHKGIFSNLKIFNNQSISLFIIFLTLMEEGTENWQSVEEQIADYIKDMVDICNNINQEIREYIIENRDEIEKNIKKYSEIVIKEMDLSKSKEIFYKSFEGIKKEIYSPLIEILTRKSIEYVNNVEKQIADYTEDIIDICNNTNQKIREYIIENRDEIEKNIKKYSEIVIKEMDLSKSKEILCKSFEGIKKEIYSPLIEILMRKSIEYINNKNDYKKHYIDYVQNIIYKVEYIYFSLQILSGNPKEFNIKTLDITSLLKKQLANFEKYFGTYASKINDVILNIIKESSETIMLENYLLKEKINLNYLKKEIDKKLENIFSFKEADKYIVSFNYTTYLDFYKKNTDKNIPIKNLKSFININGNVNEFSKFKDKEEEIIKKILNEVEKQVTYLKEEVESIKNLEQNKDIVDFKKILQKILNDTKKTYKRNLKQIKSDLELEITVLKNHYEDYRVEKRLKDKLFEILDFEEDEVFDSEIIFGIDKLQKDENYKELSNFFKPNRRSKEVNRDINELLKKNFTKIYFYGHSLADADFTFFEDLFKSNVKLDFINKVQTELVFLYERDFFNDENIKNIVKLFYNYYFFSNSDNPKTEDEILDLIFSLRKKGILKIKIRENNKDEYEEQKNILILDNREKLKELLLKIKR